MPEFNGSTAESVALRTPGLKGCHQPWDLKTDSWYYRSVSEPPDS
jgi:hypothetical protein